MSSEPPGSRFKRFLDRYRKDAGVTVDTKAVHTPGRVNGGLTQVDLRKTESKRSTLQDLLNKPAPEMATQNKMVLYTTGALVQLIESYQLDPQKVISECEQTKAKYKMDSGVRKVDAEIAEQLILYSANHEMVPIKHNPDFWVDIPLFLEGVSFTRLSVFSWDKERWRPPPREIGGPVTVVESFSPTVDASFIVKKLEDFNNKVLPGYGISSIDIYMLAKMGWLTDRAVSRMIKKYVDKDENVQMVMQYVPTLRNIVLYGYDYKNPEKCNYLSLDAQLGRSNKPDESAVFYTNSVYQFLMKEFNKNYVGRVMIPGLKFTADELASWMSKLHPRELSEGFFAMMLNESLLEESQKDRFAAALHNYFSVDPLDQAKAYKDIGRLATQLAAQKFSLAYENLIKNVVTMDPPDRAKLVELVRKIAGTARSDKDLNVEAPRIPENHPTLGRHRAVVVKVPSNVL